MGPNCYPLTKFNNSRVCVAATFKKEAGLKAVKVAFLVIALFAMASSLTPLLAVDPFTPAPDSGSGGGGGSWTVTCTYDQNERLISKSCTSGGSHSCNCP